MAYNAEGYAFYSEKKSSHSSAVTVTAAEDVADCIDERNGGLEI